MSYLDTAQKIQEYVTVHSNFNPDSLKPFLKRANRKYLQSYVGDLYTELAVPATGENAVIKNNARDLFEESLCCFSFYLGSAELSLHINDSGISTHESADFKKADSFEKNDFNREMLRNGHEALDHLLKILEANKALFSSYTVELQDQHKELLVPDTATFQKYYNINSSRQTFIALLPSMRQVQDQFISSWLCKDFITALRENVSDAKLEVKILLQQAIVAYTVAKTVYEGQFLLNGNGIHLKFDRLPHESIVTNVNLKINDFLIHTHRSKNAAGEEYLKAAKRLIKENTFQECEGVVIKETNATSGIGEILSSVNNKIMSI